MQKQPCEPSFGADVEVFLASKTDGEIVPCVGKFPGTKKAPHTPEGWPKGYAIQEDNVMLEFNIPPATNYRDGYKHIRTITQYINEMVGKQGLFPCWSIPEHRFLQKDLRSNQASTFGCDPDFDAYTGAKMRVNPPSFGSNRFCGGHIHLGGDFKCPDFVAALFAELFLTQYLAYEWSAKKKKKAGWKDMSEEKYRALYGKKKPVVEQVRKPTMSRKDWYGLPGIFRPKPYGIEYRTPNNQWITQHPDNVAATAINCATFLTTTSAYELQKLFRSIPWASLREAIIKENFDGYWGINQQARAAGVPL